MNNRVIRYNIVERERKDFSLCGKKVLNLLL